MVGTLLGGSRLRATTLVVALVMAVCAGLVSGAPAQAAPPKPTGLKAQVGPTAVVVSWTPVKGATSYRVQMASSASYDQPILDESTANTRATPTQEVPLGKVFWRVAVVTPRGTSTWATATFNRSQRPGPLLSEPADGTVLEQPAHPPVLRWQPVSGARSYSVEIDGEEGDWVDTVSYDTKTTAVVPTETQQPGTYWWRVRANFDDGINSLVSSARSYTIEPLPDVVLGSSTPTMEQVVLQWDPVPGASDYEIRVSTDNGFNVITDQRIVTGTRYSPATTYGNASYWWQVRPRDVFGQTAEWPVYPDRTGEFRRNWPVKPQLVYPSAGATPTGDLYFQWEPSRLASHYLLDVGTDPNFSSQDFFNTCKTTQTTYTPGWGTRLSRLDPCLPTGNGTWYWRVRAIDGPKLVNSIISDARAFTYVAPTPSTGDLPPTTGQQLTLEGNGTSPCAASLASEEVCADVTSTPTLDWDPVPGAAFYRIYLAHDRELTNIVYPYGDSGLPDTLPLTTNTRWTPVSALPDTQAGEAYYWFVRPCRSDGTCGPTPVEASNAFQKKSAPVALVSPADNATLADQITFDWTDYLATNQATTDPSTGEHPTQAARSYRIEVAQNSSFVATRTDKVWREVVDQTTFTAPAYAYPEGVLYWRVQAIDGAFTPSPNNLTWSPTRQFTKASPTPVATSPTEGQVVNGVQPFRWEPRLYARYYDLEVYRNSDTTASPANLALWATNVRQTAFTAEEPLQALGKDFVWRLRRSDYSGNKSAWGPWHRFRVAGAPSTLLSPGSTVNRKRSLFSWRASPQAAYYRWELRRGSSIEKIVQTSATSYAPLVQLDKAKYAWRVRTFDTDGNSLGATRWRKVLAQ